ncbi:hypothetical protein [Desulfosporosinus sp. BG]|uniref:hypothetical protein n=1 Tax=Desulfosporosinus sp. BG TaxID=1633135 RepID=UPI00083A3791|nr:hypothetical protein [Desulfosporosinus sp. BG]ODA42739.1 hypothetical protein DSBG_0357 [Desulfosporosinus sp. BG]
MAKDKVKFLVVLVGILLIIGSCGFSVYINSKAFIANKDLTHDELTKCIDQYWFQGKPINFIIDLEENVDNLHLLLLSYRPTPNFSQVTGLAAFKRLPNNKYRYDTFFQGSPVVLVTNKGTNSEKDYGVFFGMITNNQPTKYLITVDGGKEFTDTLEKNKYFIRVYDLNKQKGFGMRPIYN